MVGHKIPVPYQGERDTRQPHLVFRIGKNFSSGERSTGRFVAAESDMRQPDRLHKFFEIQSSSLVARGMWEWKLRRAGCNKL